MTTKTWTCTIKNGTTDPLQAPYGLDLLTAASPSGSPPQWALAAGAQTILQCNIDSGQQNNMTGTMTWSGPNGTAQLNWAVPPSGTPTYNPTFSGYSVGVTDSSATAVTFTILGGSTQTGAGAAPPPQGSPARATPTTGSTTLAKPTVPQLWMLGDLKGSFFPHFNCGYYGNPTKDKLIGEEEFGDPVDNPKNAAGQPRMKGGVAMTNGKNTRTRVLQHSGCGLFALSSILGGYDCIVPDWDPTANRLKDNSTLGTADMRTAQPDGTHDGSPRLFLHYLWHYIIMNNALNITTEAQAREDTRPHILAPDGPGAIWYAEGLASAISFMFSYHPSEYDAQGKRLANAPSYSLSFNPQKGVSAAGGTEIKELTDAIRIDHQPVIIGIGKSASTHQNLVVGVAKYNTSTYYITLDSGYSGDNHPGGLLTATTPLVWNDILKHTVSDKAGWGRPGRPNIYWMRTYTGNDAFNNQFDCTLVCKQIREW